MPTDSGNKHQCIDRSLLLLPQGGVVERSEISRQMNAWIERLLRWSDGTSDIFVMSSYLTLDSITKIDTYWLFIHNTNRIWHENRFEEILTHLLYFLLFLFYSLFHFPSHFAINSRQHLFFVSSPTPSHVSGYRIQFI